ncbi:MAG: winged helix-turn-helix transcriptional regulator [Candidatus Aenigmarchaeota archaeon]|nr:winged helix-turn-helix transcriptional regulator [Candidatus Aenigmarchaeota archaeon]
MVRISNLKILNILQDNSRTPFIEIAKRLGVTDTAIRKRINKMEKLGIIRKYTVEVDPKKIGYPVDALIGIDTEPEYYISMIERLKDMKIIRKLFSSSGDHMIMMECWFKASQELRDFVKKLESIQGVTRVCPAIILERIK